VLFGQQATIDRSDSTCDAYGQPVSSDAMILNPNKVVYHIGSLSLMINEKAL
jgi:hypothetical protein